MATTDITITINTPPSITISEALRLFSDSQRYQTQIWDATGTGGYIPNPETRAAFSKRAIAEQVQQRIRNQYNLEAKQAVVAAIATGEQITVS